MEIGNDGDVILVEDMTEDQAKEGICRLIDCLEAIEISAMVNLSSVQKWRGTKLPKARRAKNV